jgi:hypothetical protein
MRRKTKLVKSSSNSNDTVKFALEQAAKNSATPRLLYPRKRKWTHCIGGWVGPRSGLDGCGNSRPHRDSIPGPSVAIPTELSRCTQIRTIISRYLTTRCWAARQTGISVSVYLSLKFYNCLYRIGYLDIDRWLIFQTKIKAWNFYHRNLPSLWVKLQRITYSVGRKRQGGNDYYSVDRRVT